MVTGQNSTAPQGVNVCTEGVCVDPVKMSCRGEGKRCRARSRNKSKCCKVGLVCGKAISLSVTKDSPMQMGFTDGETVRYLDSARRRLATLFGQVQRPL